MVDHDPADRNAAASTDADADPSDGRDESLNERMDRNWNEMLQELRVTQTGTQILTGFLLAIAFQNRFEDLTSFQHRIYLILVMAAMITTALGLAPVNLHRVLFRQHAKEVVVTVAHVLLRFTLLGVGAGAGRHRVVDLRCGGGSAECLDRGRGHLRRARRSSPPCR